MNALATANSNCKWQTRPPSKRAPHIIKPATDSNKSLVLGPQIGDWLSVETSSWLWHTVQLVCHWSVRCCSQSVSQSICWRAVSQKTAGSQSLLTVALQSWKLRPGTVQRHWRRESPLLEAATKQRQWRHDCERYCVCFFFSFRVPQYVISLQLSNLKVVGVRQRKDRLLFYFGRESRPKL
jgi:hypothetical protein